MTRRALLTSAAIPPSMIRQGIEINRFMRGDALLTSGTVIDVKTTSTGKTASAWDLAQGAVLSATTGHPVTISRKPRYD